VSSKIIIFTIMFLAFTTSSETPLNKGLISIRYCCCYKHVLVFSNLGHYEHLPIFNQLADDRKLHFLIVRIVETCKAILAQKLDCQCNVTDQLIAYFICALDEYNIFHATIASSLGYELNAKINHYIELSYEMIVMHELGSCSTSDLKQFIVDLCTILNPKV
jgi:hypothetical protein